MMVPHYLDSHIHLCLTDDHAVLLDLRQHKYLGLDAAQMRILASLIPGWPAEGPPPVDVRLTEEEARFVSELLETGILTLDPRRGKAATPASVPRPQNFTLRPVLWRETRIRLRDIWKFVGACLLARATIRHKRLQLAARASGTNSRESAAHEARAAERLAAVFRRCRPFFFTTVDACLFDSLALLFFLEKYGVTASCVLGVKTRPFGAHAWVQFDHEVLNDSPEFVRRYTPIFAFQRKDLIE